MDRTWLPMYSIMKLVCVSGCCGHLIDVYVSLGIRSDRHPTVI